MEEAKALQRCWTLFSGRTIMILSVTFQACLIADSAPPPWTLSAFMAYLVQNHCLETLEFTMDASRYRKHYENMHTHPGTPASLDSESYEYVAMLWQKLLDAYIAPNGPREVNLPPDECNRLTELPCTPLLPYPSEIESALKKN